MKSTNIRQRIGFGFVAITLIAVAFGSFAVYRLTLIRADADRIMQSSLPAMARVGNLAGQMQTLGDRSSVLFMKAILSLSDELRTSFALQIQTNLVTAENLVGAFEHELASPEEKTAFDNFRETFATGTPGGITCVKAGDVTAAVKVVKVDGHAPGDADYKLKL